jgi:anaerobic magnesium-protoporphyrin IX monomethyl ester cyclase
MKVLLMMPPMTIDENYANLKAVASNMPSIGLAYVYAAFKEVGCDVKFKDYQCQKVVISDVIRYVEEERFDIIGMQSYITNINRCFKVASLIKNKRNQAKIIIGGPHATLFPDKVIEHPAIDYVVIGEAEYTVKELVECLNYKIEPKDVLGLYYKDINNKIHKNPRRNFVEDVDKLPVPAYEIFNADDYFPAVHIRGRRVHNIITSRGCPFKCKFCSATKVYGNRIRYQSIDRTLNEMKLLKTKMGVDSLQIYDDNFTTNKKRTKNLCIKMIEENLNLQWVCYTRADSIGDYEMLLLMKKAGCYMIVVGIENGNERILKLINKQLNLDVARKNIELAERAKINVLSSFMIGLPSETIKEIENTIEFSTSLALTYATYPIFTPYPGTPIYEDATYYGTILSENFDEFSRWGDGVYSSNGIDPRIYRKLQAKAFRSFYLRPIILFKVMREFLKLPPDRVYAFVKGGVAFLVK